MDIQDSILGKIKVRVYKKQKDDRLTLCGEPLKVGEDGREFFEVPAHQAKYLKDVYPQYVVTEEFAVIPVTASSVVQEVQDARKKDNKTHKE